MPLGDSITDGSSYDSPDGTGGYRGPLFDALTADGYNVESVGSLTINSTLRPLAEKSHEGHSGWRIDQLDSGIAGWFETFPDPDVILMHIGTNDFGQNLNTTTAIDRLDALILKITQLRPYAHIVVTNLMERGEPQNAAIQAQFNPYVQARVDAHAAAGRRVTFLDMRSAVPLSDMPDSLHPDQNGYVKMAAAWLPKIEAIIGPDGDAAPPEIARARGAADRTHVAITFSKPVADSAATASNFTLSGGITVSAATLSADKRVVTLTTSTQTLGTTYTATVSGVQDRLFAPNSIAPGSTKTFAAATPRGYLNNVPESVGYTLACSLDVPNLANYSTAQPTYSIDNRSAVGPFSRVAYYVELQSASGDLQYLWTSMNAFTSDVNKIAVPTAATGAVFQQNVASLNVVSNVPGIVTGTGLAGNLEFWPTNYSAENGVGISGASDATYDFGDTITPSGTYGSMQLHNAAAGQTLFAFNNWGGATTNTNADLGIGTNPGASGNGSGPQPDWTFSNSAGNYSIKTIQVLVQTTGDLTGPTAASAFASFGRTTVTVSFSEPLAAGSVKAGDFTIDNGVVVLGATLAANQRDVILTTTTQPVAPLTLTISGIRDSSPNANLIAPGSTIAVSAPALPPEIVANVGAASNGYELVYSLDVPVTGNLNAAGAAAYSVNDSTAGAPFTRVAYYLELQKTGQPSQFAWVSMDAFSAGRKKLGVPTVASGAFFQRNVTNMEVVSNVAGVVNGSGIATGNLEFWPSNYAAAKAAASPANADDATLDFGDSGASTGAGYGSMQIHNYGAAQTVLAINHFGVDGQPLDVGIGTNPNASANASNGQKDWTFTSNAGTYSRRILHVLVLPGVTTPPAVTAIVPEAANYQLLYTLDIPTTGNLVSGTGFQPYTVNNAADVGQFKRVAYLMELQKTGDASTQYVWTSMDAFSTDPLKVGVPTPASGAVFQGPVANMNVVSNVAGVVNGTGITTGNIEFWPTNYSQPVVAGVLPGNPGSTTAYDFNDTRTTTGAHGSMQIHNYGAAQTLFAINHWGTAGAGATSSLEMGIGNNPNGAQAPDWTLTNNGSSYDVKRVLRVFVLPGSSDLTGPAITRITPSTTLNRLVVTFSETVADGAANPANFALDGSVNVTGATLLPGNREIALTTSAQTAGTLYTVSAGGIRDRSPNGNVTVSATATFTAYTPPAVLANVPDAGYQLIYRLAIPAASGLWNLNTIPYSVDEAKYGERPFDRVAYLMELDGNWVYASFDPVTSTLAKVGVPTLTVSATPFQQIVAHMNVASNVAGIATGTDIATGNIEFWGGNYQPANAIGIPNASATDYDFGDVMTAGQFGSMQVHNYDLDGSGPAIAGQTILAYNNWGGNVNPSELGIGNNPTAGSPGVGGTQQPDYTFTQNAGTYTTRNLYVLVRPGGTAVGPAPQLFSQPTSRIVAAGGSTTLAVSVMGSGPYTYQWRRNGVAILGATDSFLDITGFGSGKAGTYDVIVTSAAGVSTTSLGAVLSLPNANPAFTSFAFTIGVNEPASIAASDILAKATDPDGDTLTVTSAGPGSTQGGTVSLNSGVILYTPATAFMGADTFTLTIGDGKGGSVIGNINATVTSAPLNPGRQSTVTVRADGKVDLLFYGTPGQSYIIERTLDFSVWQTLQTATPGDDGLLPFTDPNPPVGNAFYRTRIP